MLSIKVNKLYLSWGSSFRPSLTVWHFARTLKLWMHFIEDMWREVLTELSSLVNPRFSLWFDFINFYRHSRTFMEQSQHFSAFNYRLSAECSSATLFEEMLETFSWEDDEWPENYSSRHLSYLGNWVMALSQEGGRLIAGVGSGLLSFQSESGSFDLAQLDLSKLPIAIRQSSVENVYNFCR